MAVSRGVSVFEPDLVGIAEIGTSPEWRAWVEGTAQAISVVARAEGSSVQGTGQYNASWEGLVELSDLHFGNEGDLPLLPYFIGVCRNNDWHSTFVEYGAKPNNKRTPNPTPAQKGGHLKHQPPKHVLLQAFERVVGALETGGGA